MKNSEPNHIETTPPAFDYKECYHCGSTIRIMGTKYCSDLCQELYKNKLKKKFG